MSELLHTLRWTNIINTIKSIRSQAQEYFLYDSIYKKFKTELNSYLKKLV